MAEETTTELVSTVGTLACAVASCNIVKADENGLVILSEFPKTTGGITLGGGGYIPGQGIVIGEGNSTTQGDDVIIGSNITTTDAYYEGGNIAIGNKAEVSQGGIAIGSSFTDEGTERTTKATCYNSVAIGVDAEASGMFSTALGKSAKASGRYSTALGAYACATGEFSTALGYWAKTSGQESTALGYDAEASGMFSTALGAYACATGEFSTALGTNARACGAGALAIGYCAEAAENEIVLRSINSGNTARNVLKVSSAGVMTLNTKCMLPLETLATAANTVTKFTDAELTGKDYSLEDVATKLNQLLTALQGLSL